MRADNNSLVNDIYISLKQDILWLRLKPRTTLTESELAEIYKTSKTPIREALSMLVRDELVSVFPRKGYMVTEVSLTDMRDMHQYRYILENANLSTPSSTRRRSSSRASTSSRSRTAITPRTSRISRRR